MKTDKRREINLVGETDAVIWASEFTRMRKENPKILEEDCMLGWFANSIMAGYDKALTELDKIRDEEMEALREESDQHYLDFQNQLALNTELRHEYGKTLNEKNMEIENLKKLELSEDELEREILQSGLEYQAMITEKKLETPYVKYVAKNIISKMKEKRS